MSRTQVFVILMVIISTGCIQLLTKLAFNTTNESWQIIHVTINTTNDSSQIIQPPSQNWTNGSSNNTIFAGVTCQNNACSTNICIVNYSKSLRMKSFAPQVAKLCEDNYPKIVKLLANKSPPSPNIIFMENQTNPGLTAGTIVYLSSDWFAQHPDDLGAIVHELTHVVQSYHHYNPSWLVEGIADNVRYDLGYQTSWSYPHCTGSENYTVGYSCAATLLMYVEKTDDPNLIAKLNQVLSDGTYSDNLFETDTGRSLEELWLECAKNDCNSSKT